MAVVTRANQDRRLATLEASGGTVIAPSGDTTGATDTAAIQAAMDAQFTAGGGTVRLLRGTYYTTQLKLRTLVSLRGADRFVTILKAPLGQATNLHQIVLNDTTTYGWRLTDLTIDGSNGQFGTWPLQTNRFDAINLTGGGGGGLFGTYQVDMLGNMANLLVVNASNMGITLSGRIPELRIDNVYVFAAYNDGWSISSQDTFISNSTAGYCGQDGFNVGGAVIQLSNSKAFWNGRQGLAGHKNGFTVGGAGHTVSNCFGQDNFGFGFIVKGNYNRVQGIASGNTTASVDVFAATNCMADITVGNQNDQAATPTYVVQWDSGTPSVGCAVTVRGYMLNGTAILNALNSPSGNRLIIGNEDGGHQAVAYAATVTPNIYAGGNIVIGSLTGNITVANPAAANVGHVGSVMTLTLAQDATGGRTVTFGALYKTTGAITTTLSTTTVITFVHDGTNWRETGRAVT